MKKFYKNKIKCSICESKNLLKIIDLKKFPITGIYIKKKIKKNFPYYINQELKLCKKCGHLQLGKFVSPELLYNNLYSNRTSDNHLSSNGIKFFKNFLYETTKKKFFGNLLEVGCSDIKLIESLKNNFNHLCGIDPIWISKTKPKNKKFTIIGDFVEKIEFKKKIGNKIDVFVSAHNLEHIENPLNMLKTILKNTDNNTTFFIEVPDADLMIKNLRFDQVFHQHYHYFNFNSLNNLIRVLGCKIIKRKINPNFWGGSILIAFKKDNTVVKKKISNNYYSIKRKIIKNYKKFKNKYKKLNNLILKKDINIGYGAGQMVPSFAYHLKSKLNFLDYIVDDNKKRSNKKYPFLYPDIKYFKKPLLNNKKVLITALDGVDTISGKLKNMKIEFYNPLK
jgi:2-polyprenyl-3-methyl-5-hydroxy-6-metoxy-1,4-benzoquinol methylase